MCARPPAALALPRLPCLRRAFGPSEVPHPHGGSHAAERSGIVPRKPDVFAPPRFAPACCFPPWEVGSRANARLYAPSPPPHPTSAHPRHTHRPSPRRPRARPRFRLILACTLRATVTPRPLPHCIPLRTLPRLGWAGGVEPAADAAEPSPPSLASARVCSAQTAASASRARGRPSAEVRAARSVSRRDAPARLPAAGRGRWGRKGRVAGGPPAEWVYVDSDGGPGAAPGSQRTPAASPDRCRGRPVRRGFEPASESCTTAAADGAE